MAGITVKFPSYSSAAAVHDYLNANYINSKIVRTAPGINQSCGYSIKIPPGNAKEAELLLSMSGLTSRKTRKY